MIRLILICSLLSCAYREHTLKSMQTRPNQESNGLIFGYRDANKMYMDNASFKDRLETHGLRLIAVTVRNPTDEPQILTVQNLSLHSMTRQVPIADASQIVEQNAHTYDEYEYTVLGLISLGGVAATLENNGMMIAAVIVGLFNVGMAAVPDTEIRKRIREQQSLGHVIEPGKKISGYLILQCEHMGPLKFIYEPESGMTL